ncbi:hypothetical protein VCHA54P496_20381 [Vibrio chagasii]|nr:hypothetical protein VCHA54P495_20381 [Vibrio chagasii]CAH7218981.1 hypothetical protein VCHA54P496_20381 [Vibrio chagasii]CAH7265364.1 hypothetical protein VCHA54P486_10132 [Vibrio chagasii]
MIKVLRINTAYDKYLIILVRILRRNSLWKTFKLRSANCEDSR